MPSIWQSGRPPVPVAIIRRAGRARPRDRGARRRSCPFRSSGSPGPSITTGPDRPRHAETGAGTVPPQGRNRGARARDDRECHRRRRGRGSPPRQAVPGPACRRADPPAGLLAPRPGLPRRCWPSRASIRPSMPRSAPRRRRRPPRPALFPVAAPILAAARGKAEPPCRRRLRCKRSRPAGATGGGCWRDSRWPDLGAQQGGEHSPRRVGARAGPPVSRKLKNRAAYLEIGQFRPRIRREPLPLPRRRLTLGGIPVLVGAGKSGTGSWHSTSPILSRRFRAVSGQFILRGPGAGCCGCISRAA